MKGAELLRGLVALGALAFAGQARAQSAAELVVQGIALYENLEFDAAAGLLRRALDTRGPNELIGRTRAEALVYLSATEVFRQNQDSARAAFRRLVAFDPRFRPDAIVFPPVVVNLYEQVRRETKAIAARAPADTTFPPGGPGIAVWLYVSSFHEVAVTIRRDDDRPLRVLYAGPIGDSLEVRWDGADSTGRAVPPGRYALVAASHGEDGRVIRMLRVPLELARVKPDTLLPPPAPHDSLFLPERMPFGPALSALAKGALVGVGLALVPATVGRGEDAMGARFVVGGALTVAGIVGFLAHQPGRPIATNADRNRQVRERWEQERQRIARQNAVLREGVRVRVRAGPASVIDPETP